MKSKIWSMLKMATDIYAQRLKYRFGKPISPPVSVGITFTNRCNLSCPMCIWKGTDEKYLSTERIIALFGELAEMGVRGITNYGGEPLLRKDLPEILNEAKKNGMRVSITTNAVMVPKINAMEVLKYVDHLNVSIDSPIASQYDFSRGKTGAFKELLIAMEQIKDIRRTLNNSLEMKIHSMVTPGTIHDPFAMVELCRKFEVPFVTYAFPADPTFKHIGDETYLSKLREWAQSEKNYQALDSMIERILSLMDIHNKPFVGNPFFAVNPFYIKGGVQYFSQSNPINSRSCFVVNPVISGDGTLSMCCAGPTPIGNINEKAFFEIWNDKHASEIRKRIAQGMCGEHCYHIVRHLESVTAKTLLNKPGFSIRSLRQMMVANREYSESSKKC